LDDDLSAEIIPGVTGRHPWPSVNKIESLFSKLGITDKSQLVIYDQHHGGIAARFWAMCLYVGIENAAVLNGGWKSWIENEYEVSTKQSSFKPSNFIAKDPLFAIIDVDELDKYECIIDARASKRYKGVEEPIDPIAGHIPGALNINGRLSITSDNGLKISPQISLLFIADQV